MQPLKKRLKDLSENISKALEVLSAEELNKQISELEAETNSSDIWNNPAYAQAKMKELSVLKQTVEPWQIIKSQVADMTELIELGDESLLNEFEEQVLAFEKEYQKLKIQLFFVGEYDKYDVILRITAGVGGTDAQDWAEMLERMYLRYAEKNNFKTTILERSASEEAGIKTSVFEVEGTYAYGKLKGEHGVHRLVRLSPFNSDNLRQTSFALVEVLPKIDEPKQIELPEKDLKIDVYRAGGHGGQSVNTTDSAVRITHLPTGISVAIQNERSQLQNKETALKILSSKLTQLKLEQHAQNITELQAGESASWGSQIRNYVLHPYTLVKDTRTKYEEKDAQKVLDGQLDGFMNSFLEGEAEKRS